MTDATHRFTERLGEYLSGGVMAILPLVVTIVVLWFAYVTFSDVVALFSGTTGLTRYYINIPIIGGFLDVMGKLIVLMLIILVLGLFVSTRHGKRVWNAFERFMSGIPIIRIIYAAVRRGVDAFMIKGQEFKRVCLIEFPRRGAFALGFITGEVFGGVEGAGIGEMYCVFVPTSPVIATGFLIMSPKADVIPLDMSIEEGLKMLLSGGFIAPEDSEEKRAQGEIWRKMLEQTEKGE